MPPGLRFRPGRRRCRPCRRHCRLRCCPRSPATARAATRCHPCLPVGRTTPGETNRPSMRSGPRGARATAIGDGSCSLHVGVRCSVRGPATERGPGLYLTRPASAPARAAPDGDQRHGTRPPGVGTCGAEVDDRHRARRALGRPAGEAVPRIHRQRRTPPPAATRASASSALASTSVGSATLPPKNTTSGFSTPPQTTARDHPEAGDVLLGQLGIPVGGDPRPARSTQPGLASISRACRTVEARRRRNRDSAHRQRAVQSHHPPAARLVGAAIHVLGDHAAR
jgi:hypothetical protein